MPAELAMDVAALALYNVVIMAGARGLHTCLLGRPCKNLHLSGLLLLTDRAKQLSRRVLAVFILHCQMLALAGIAQA